MYDFTTIETKKNLPPGWMREILGLIVAAEFVNRKVFVFLDFCGTEYGCYCRPLKFADKLSVVCSPCSVTRQINFDFLSIERIFYDEAAHRSQRVLRNKLEGFGFQGITNFIVHFLLQNAFFFCICSKSCLDVFFHLFSFL